MIRFILPFLAVVSMSVGCAPTVKVQAPDKPIVINLNVKIEHEVRVKLEKEADDVITDNEDIF